MRLHNVLLGEYRLRGVANSKREWAFRTASIGGREVTRRVTKDISRHPGDVGFPPDRVEKSERKKF